MITGTDRRSVLTGLGALSVAGCAPDAGNSGQLVALDLSALERRHDGRIGVAAFSGPKQTGWRAGERFLYCSTFKLFLAIATLQRAAEGQEGLARAVPILQADMVPHAPVTEPAVGGTMTIEALCQAAVEQSDNPAANILIREMGGRRAFREWYASIGDTVTRVDRAEPDLNSPNGEQDTTTPAQAVTNLDVVLHRGSPIRGQIVPVLTRWLLASPTGPGRIKAAAPAGWRVAHKTGTSDFGQTNDIGVMHAPQGDTVTLAVYFDAPATASAEQRDAVVAEVTRHVLKALGHD